MSDDTLIKVEGVSKKFCRSLNRSIQYGLQDVVRDLVDLSSRPGELRKGEFWAVDDASFELKKGETFGIIGPNGSGKTTILKLLNGIFMPDKGSIEIKGRIGTLIDVGVGFHPLLTGRENIYVNGAIHAMSKKEIDRKFNSIVDFAEIGNFLDSPVKFYSSGMYVRLGFAVAIHSEPDILLVDEVLAVGDVGFRNKCYQKMNELKKKGIAIVIVSHNLFTVEKFCDKGVFLVYGKVESQGEIHKVLQDYQSQITRGKTGHLLGNESVIKANKKEAEIINVEFLDRSGQEKEAFAFGEPLNIKVTYKAKNTIYNPNVEISLWNSDSVRICTFATFLDDIRISSIGGEGVIECLFENIPLLSDKYFIIVTIYDETCTLPYDAWHFATRPNLFFSVLPNQTSAKMAEYSSICHFRGKWKVDGVKY